MKLRFGSALVVLTFLCFDSADGGALKKLFSSETSSVETKDNDKNDNERPKITEESKTEESTNTAESKQEEKKEEQKSEEKKPEPPKVAADEKVTPPSEKKKIEGNPVVCKMVDEEIHRDEVLEFITTLPPQLLQSVPSAELFEVGKKQTIALHLLIKQAKRMGLNKTKDYLDRVKKLSERLLSEMYLMKEIAPKAQNEADLKARYQKYLIEFKADQEVKLSHIALDTEAAAKEVISALSKGANFEKLRKEKGNASSESSDRYFPLSMIPEDIRKGLAPLKKNEYTKKPIKIGEGWHVFKIIDKRATKPRPYDEEKFLLGQMIMKDEMDKLIVKLRKQYNVEEFNEDGTPISAKN